MLTKYVRRISSRDCPIVLSITETTTVEETETVIQRNYIREMRETSSQSSNDIYLRARDIYLVSACAAAGAGFLAFGTLLGELLLAAADPRVREDIEA